MKTTDLRKKLDEKLNIISTNIPKHEWKYFHRGSIKNFIINIDSIKGKIEKINTWEIINNCLHDVEINFQADINYSIYLFNSFLKYIIPIYRNRLGFSAIPNRNVLILLISIISATFILLLKYRIWEILFCCTILIFISNSVIKFRRHKVYGFRY